MSHSLASVTRNSGTAEDNIQLLGTKTPLRAGIWNYRSGIDGSARLDIVLATAQTHKLDILSIPESAKSGYGKMEVAHGYVLFWTGPPQPQRRMNRGVALLLSPRAASALRSCSQISPRILHAEFSLLRRLTLDVVAAYAPAHHFTRGVDTKLVFRRELQAVRQSVNTHHF